MKYKLQRTSILLDAESLSIWFNGPRRTGWVSLCSKRRIAVSVKEVGAKLLGYKNRSK